MKSLTASVAVSLGLLSACGGVAWNTKIAESPDVRRAMVQSVRIGETTQKALITRWGQPTQKVYDGGQVEFIYRDMSDARPRYVIQYGDSSRYVIVTFQYGVATGVRTNETEGCRATFPPRPPGAGFDTPSTVYPVGACAALTRPGVPQDVFVPADGLPK